VVLSSAKACFEVVGETSHDGSSVLRESPLVRDDGKTDADEPHLDLPGGKEPYTISVHVKPRDTHEPMCVIAWGGMNHRSRINSLFLHKGDQGKVEHAWWDNDLDCRHKHEIWNGEWHHLVATCDGTTRKIYLDGEEIGSDTPGRHECSGTENFGLGVLRGSIFGDQVFRFYGGMRDLRVFKSVVPVRECLGGDTFGLAVKRLQEHLPGVEVKVADFLP